MRTAKMFTPLSKILITCSLLIGLVNPSSGQEKQSGALIIADMQGNVQFLDGQGKPLEPGKIGAGDILPLDHSAVTGQPGKIIFLLSNGTLMTLTENTKMKVRTFEQVPFDPGGKKLKDLENEPSQSAVEIDLDMGSLIIKTKKLDKASSFDINSPVGVAGIRGTEFQMQSNPGAGIQLDVTESTVAFTPPGGGQAMPVGQGNGLSVSQTGVPTPRPINPVVAQTISITNQVATQVTANVSLNVVSGAMNEATAESQSKEESGEGDGEGEGEGDSEDSDSGDGESSEGGDDSSASSDSGDISGAALENNADALQARKTGKVSAMSRQLAKFGLNDEQTNRFYMLSAKAQGFIILEEKEVVQRLLSMEGFFVVQADAFFLYSAETRAQILGLDDSAIVPGLNQRIEEALLAGTLTKDDLSGSTKTKVPTVTSPLATDTEILGLSDKLKQAGHVGVMEELMELSGGELTKDWIRTGEVANILLQDYDWATALPSMLSSAEVLANPFYTPIAQLRQELENDLLIFGDSSVLGGRNQIISSNSNTLSSYFTGSTKTVIISSLEDISASESFTWETPEQSDTRLVVMSGGKMNLKQGITLQSATSDLLISSREDLELNQVTLEVADEVAVRGLKDVQLNNVTMGANLLATVKARRNLNVDGLNFNRGVSNILMEATTMRLSNVNFPVNSAIRLNTLKGAIDGRYPNFGTNISAAQQVGRVNFIKNVSTGGNVMNNRQTFDQFGNNITIGKINRP
ncbi:MAG: FecR domain-containing protein [Opitutales bacterium]|nr:FecR domain-containing protein [Opitutales bacterium]